MKCNAIGIAFTLAPSSVEFRSSDYVWPLMYNNLSWNITILCLLCIVFTGEDWSR